MSNNKKEVKLDEKTKKRNIALSRRTSEIANKNSSRISVSESASDGSVSMLGKKRNIKESDVAKRNTGFKSIGTKSKSSADNLKKDDNGLGPKAHGSNSNYSGLNNFGLK